MNKLTAGIIEQATELEKVTLEIENSFSSQSKNYRQKIRERLLATLEEKYSHLNFDREQVLDLNDRPHIQGGCCSISHSPVAGGFLLTEGSGFTCGLDIEPVGRVSESAVQRVSEPDELRQCPHFELLWVAKEAAFKAASSPSAQLSVISELKIDHWMPLSPGAWVVRGQVKSCKSVLMRGIVCHLNTLNLSVFKNPS